MLEENTDHNIQKAPPRCTKTAGPQLHGELPFALCLVTTSISLLGFNVFLFNFFSPNHLHLCSEAPASAYPSKTTSKHPCSWSATQPHVPMCQEKHHLTLLWDTAQDSEAGEGGVKNLTHPHFHVQTHTRMHLPSLRYLFSSAKCSLTQTKGTPDVFGQVMNEASL